MNLRNNNTATRECTYLYDPHVHTSEVSLCGQINANDMVQLYKKAGYQGIVTTDHYYDGFVESSSNGNWNEVADRFLKGYRAAQKAASLAALDILLGMEIRFDEGPEDYLVYGLDEEFIYKYPYLNRLGLKGFKELIEDKDILIFQAHPYRPWLKPAPPELLDGIEVYNGNPRHDSGNAKAYDYALANKLYMISGSDAHQPQDVGRGGIAVSDRLYTSVDLVNAFVSFKPMNLLQT